MAAEERAGRTPPEDGTDEVRTTTGGAAHSLVKEIKDSPDWLPSGWILEIKTQKSGAKAGRQIKCYYNPYTGSRFYSKNQVFQHLNAGKLLSPTTKQRTSISASSVKKTFPPTNEEKSKDSSSNNSLTEYGSNGLPQGWIKEIRLRKRQQGTKREDTFYIDPDGRYAFRSLKDAFRYIETGDVHKCASKPQKRSISEMHTVERELHFSTAAKRIDCGRAAVKRCLFSDKSPDSDVKTVTETSESPQRSTLLPPGTEVADSICNTSSFVKHLDRENSKEVTKIVTELNPTCHVVADIGQTLDLGEKSVSEPAIKMPLDSVSNEPSEPINETPETSQECSQMKQMLLHDKCLSEVSDEMWQANMRTVQQVPLTPLQQQNHSLAAPEVNLLDETKLELKNEEQSQPMKRRRGRKPGSKNAKGIKAITMPLRASKRLAALRGNQIANSGIVERFHGATANPSRQLHEKSPRILDQSAQSHLVNSRFFQQKETPLIDLEQLEELESFKHPGEECTAEKQVQLERPSNDKPLSPFRSPFGDSWPDPCLEFAFKMLTSDIPVFEDATAIPEYFRQQLGSPKNSDS